MSDTPLRKLVRRQDQEDSTREVQCALIKQALNQEGYDASLADIEWAWKKHCQDWAAQWVPVVNLHAAHLAVPHLMEYLTEETQA